MTNTLRPLPLPDDVPGKLWLSAMPGRFEPLTAFLTAAEYEGATGIVCLATDAEIATKSPDYAQARKSGSLTAPVQNHPIPDYGLPEDRETFANLIRGLCADLYRGKRLILHCAAGIGRTGLVAQHILMAFGTEPGLAHEQVKRAGSEPETASQQEFCGRAVTLFHRV
jgi:protein-tyrosine phosphatase